MPRSSFAPSLAAIAAVTLVLGGCQVPGLGEGTGGTGGSDGTGGADGGTECEQTSETCDVCASCAAQGPCVALMNACAADANCVILDDCLGLCGGEPECADGCYMQYPDAVQLHGEAMGCVYCDQCSRFCDTAAQCI